MRILALDTSTDFGSCALSIDGDIVERACPSGRPHSETLLPLVRQVLADAGMPFSRLDGIAFGAGPGAFTGLRVACGLTQGLAAACDLPVLPVVTLEAMAASVNGDNVLALLDARMGEVYSAAYARSEDGWRQCGDIRVAAPAAVPFPAGEGWVACGNALRAYPALAERVAAHGFESLPEILPTAGAVLRLALPRLARGEGLDAALAAPLYVRDKVAQTVAERLAAGGKA